MTGEAEERKQADSRAWLGDPIEHGGSYRAPETGWVPEVGCCLLQVGGIAAGSLGLAAFSLHLFLR